AKHRRRKARRGGQRRDLEAAFFKRLLERAGHREQSLRIRGHAFQSRKFIELRHDGGLMIEAVALDLGFEVRSADLQRQHESVSAAGGASNPLHVFPKFPGAWLWAV